MVLTKAAAESIARPLDVHTIAAIAASNQRTSSPASVIACLRQ
jgi:hypothetical protein